MLKVRNKTKFTLITFVEIFIPEYPTFDSSITIFSNKRLQKKKKKQQNILIFYFTRIITYNDETNIRQLEHELNWPSLTHKTSFIYTANKVYI